MSTSSRRRSLIGRTPLGTTRPTPAVRVGSDLVSAEEGNGDVETLEALAVDDFDDEWFEDDDSDYDYDDEDSEEGYTTSALSVGLRVGGSTGNRVAPLRSEQVDDLSDVGDLADIVDSVADDAVVADAPVEGAPAAASPSAPVGGTDVSSLEVKEVRREGSFVSEGRPLDSEVMTGDDAAFAITIERPTARPGRRSDQALPYLALLTSTAGMAAGALITAIGLVALASILTVVGGDDTPPEPPPEPIGADEEPPEPDEVPGSVGTDQDEAGAEDSGQEEAEEEPEQAPAPRPRRRRRQPEPEPEPEPEPPAAPEPAPVPVPVQPEPEPEPEKQRKGLFRRKKKKDK